MIVRSKSIASLFVFGFTVFFCFMQGAYALECEKHKPKTYLLPEIKPVEYIRNISSDELSSMHLGGSTSHTSRVLGLAGGPLGTKFSVDFEAVEVAKKLYCLRAKKIKAYFFAKPKIYIASNFKRGSCEYNKVLKHETEHVTILKRAHKEYTPKYRHHLRKLSYNIPTLSPTKLIDVNKQKDLLVAELNKEMSAYLSVITKDISKRQAVIDTPEEYARVYSKCKRWEKKLRDD